MTSGPAAPAALNGPSSLSDSLQNSSARHGTDINPGNRGRDRGLTGRRGSSKERPRHQHRHTFFFFFFFSTRQDCGVCVWGGCAHSVPGVCACVCLPVWITMMQSAAVLSTESPVKSLPEILGVPLQRKTFCTLPSPPRFSACKPSPSATCVAGVCLWGRGVSVPRMENLRLSRTGR